MGTQMDDNNSPSGTPTRKKRLMVVDDERDIIESVKSALKAHYWVDTANDALEALRAFKVRYYDLILLDYRMPKIDGAELYREIIRMDPMQKICFITAYDDLNIRMSRLQHGGNLNSVFHEDLLFPVLRKPFDTATLMAKIESILGQ